MRLAFLADIHGNLPALEAVMADLATQTPDAVYLLGDQINRCPWTNEVLDLLADQRWPAILGNHEYIISRIRTSDNFDPFTSQQRFPTLWWTQKELSAAHLASMRQLPVELLLHFDSAPDIYLTHGIPGNCFRGFLPEDNDEKIAKSLAAIQSPYVIVAHTHRPMDRTVSAADLALLDSRDRKVEYPGRISQENGNWWLNGWHLYNPGSIGLPYNGDPRAQYLLVDQHKDRWLPTFRRVEYDLQRLLDAFENSSMRKEIGPEVELHIRTAISGLPWSSDFSYWLQFQQADLQRNIVDAIPLYLEKHGPGRWAFS